MTGTELRQTRQRHHLTQEEMAKKIGVTANTVARWERGEVGIPEPVARLVKYLAKEVQPGRQRRFKTGRKKFTKERR